MILGIFRRLFGWTDHVRSYMGGVAPSDLQRLVAYEAPDAFAVLTRGQAPAQAKGVRGFFQHARRLFLGLSYQLSPVRRALFALALLLAVAGSCSVRVRNESVSIGEDSSGQYLLAVGILVLLLALELVDRVRVRDELEVARQLQSDLLPRLAPIVPGYGFAFAYRTAREIGGDYYHLRCLPDGRVAIVAGDASGHGIAAGLLMVIAHSTLDLAFDLDPSPRGVALLLNRVLLRTGGPRAFMTLFYGLLEPASGRLEYVTAGHPFPLLRRASGEVVELGEGGLPVGLRAELPVVAREAVLLPGDLLLVHSDGLPEAHSSKSDSALGFDRVSAGLAPGGTPQEVQQRLLADLDSFLGGEPPGDDVSLVVVGRNPA